VFRESDWSSTHRHQRFADAVVEEARGENPVVLCRLPLRAAAAADRGAIAARTILTFWTSGPNPESFGICPCGARSCRAMLGSTILGFHTRFHCKNFIETVDRYLEARIEHEYSSISYQDKETLIESYPISIEWPTDEQAATWPPVAECRRRVFERLGLADDTCLAVGIDRFDYTKGILERLRAVEGLLERYPQWRGRFVFVQVAAPTRTSLDEYRSFHERNRAHHRPHQQALRHRGLPTGNTCSRAPRARRRQRIVPCRQHVRGDQPARRHEPGQQGIRRRA